MPERTTESYTDTHDCTVRPILAGKLRKHSIHKVGTMHPVRVHSIPVDGNRSDKWDVESLATMAVLAVALRDGRSLEQVCGEEADPLCVVRGEVSLWRSVVVQAFMDALSNSGKMEMEYHKRQARVWLEGRGDDFRTVCDYAYLDPESVIAKAREVIAARDAELVDMQTEWKDTSGQLEIKSRKPSYPHLALVYSAPCVAAG